MTARTRPSRRSRIDVSGVLTFPATATSRPVAREDRAEQLCGRRLAVGAGDADDLPRPARQQAIAQLHLRPHRDAAVACDRDEQGVGRHTRRLHEHVDTVEQRHVVLVPERAVDEQGLLEPIDRGTARACGAVAAGLQLSARQGR
jgi:hypothetical protein